MTNKPFVSLDNVPLLEAEDFIDVPELSEKFGRRQARIGPMLGAKKLGFNVTVVPPGKAAYPAHNHRVNEEMFLILEGQAELRVGEQRYQVSPMDIIACPAGGVETAHQLRNVGDTDLRYLAVSTCEYPEICDYPDSNKIGVYHRAVGTDDEEESWALIARQSDERDYWEGE